MSYELHIERGEDSEPLAEEEVRRAAESINGVRWAESTDAAGVNPVTQEPFSIKTRGGTAEVYFPEETQWHPVFRFAQGGLSFRADGGLRLGDLSDPAWGAATALAKALGARILGDEGEEYDSNSGEVI